MNLKYPRVRFVRRLNKALYTYTAITQTSPECPWKRGLTFTMPNLHPFWTHPELREAWVAAGGAQ